MKIPRLRSLTENRILRGIKEDPLKIKPVHMLFFFQRMLTRVLPVKKVTGLMRRAQFAKSALLSIFISRILCASCSWFALWPSLLSPLDS